MSDEDKALNAFHALRALLVMAADHADEYSIKLTEQHKAWLRAFDVRPSVEEGS